MVMRRTHKFWDKICIPTALPPSKFGNNSNHGNHTNYWSGKYTSDTKKLSASASQEEREKELQIHRMHFTAACKYPNLNSFSYNCYNQRYTFFLYLFLSSVLSFFSLFLSSFLSLFFPHFFLYFFLLLFLSSFFLYFFLLSLFLSSFLSFFLISFFLFSSFPSFLSFFLSLFIFPSFFFSSFFLPSFFLSPFLPFLLFFISFFLPSFLSFFSFFLSFLFPQSALFCPLTVGADGYCCTWSHSVTHMDTDTLGVAPLYQWSALRTDLYLTTRNSQQTDRHTSGRIRICKLASERLQTHMLYGAATKVTIFWIILIR